MFGGNPGGKQGKEHKLRLGDFWSLSLLRPTRDQIQRRCQLAIRRVQFDELVHVNKMAALKYLQGPVSEVVDHSNPEEEAEVIITNTCSPTNVGAFSNQSIGPSFSPCALRR